MAASGYMSTSNQYVVYWIDVSYGNYDAANNRTPVTVGVYAKRTNTGYTTWGSGSIALEVNGSRYDVSKDISISSSTVLLHSWSGNIPHNADGTKTLGVAAAINISGVLSSGMQAFYVNLPRIPRMSSWTMSPTTTTLGSNVQIQITPAASGFTHAVHYWIGSEHRYIRNWDSRDTTVNFNLPISDAVYNTSGTSITVNIYVATYTGSTFVADSFKTLTLTFPASVKPSIGDLQLTAVNSYWGMWIQGKTSFKLKVVNPQMSYNSPITSYKYEGAGYAQTVSNTNEVSFGVINTSGDFPFRVTATDARGRSATYEKMQLVWPYEVPKLTTAEVRRCTANGTYDDDNGTYVKIKVAGSWTSLKGNNNGGVRWRWRLVGSGSWSGWSELTNNAESAALGGGIFSTEKAYEIVISVYDYFTQTDSTIAIMSKIYPMDVLNTGRGVSFGKVAEREGYADFAFATYFAGGNNQFDGPVKAFGGHQVGMQFEDGKPYYHHDKGYLVTTNIQKSVNTMFELYIVGNGYSSFRPIDIKINGYVYNSDIVQLQGYDACYSSDMCVFFNSDNKLCLWFQQAANYSTFRFKLCTSFGQTNPSYTVTNAAKPGNITVEKWIPKIRSWHSANATVIVDRGTNGNGTYWRYSDGTQRCIKSVWIDVPCTSVWGGVYASGFFDLGNWAATFSEPPHISAQLIRGNFHSCWHGGIQQGTGGLAIGTLELYRGTSASSVQGWVHLIAEGKYSA